MDDESLAIPPYSLRGRAEMVPAENRCEDLQFMVQEQLVKCSFLTWRQQGFS